MKKIFITGAVSLLLLFVSCKPVIPETRSGDAYFESFTFLHSLNSSLDRDYEATWNAQRGAWVAGPAPATTDLSVLKPIFKTVSGSKVFHNGVEVYSGISYFDFTQPVQFTIIAENGTSKLWTVAFDKLEPLPASITVMTYNVEDMYRGNINRHDAMAQIIKNASVEIAVLCEIQANGTNPGSTQDDVSLLKTVLANIGWAMPYSCFADSSDGAGNDDIVIISKYPIIAYEEILPPGTWPRKGIKAVIEVSDGSITKNYTVIGLHLKAFDDADSVQKRLDQSQALANYLRTTYSANTLTTGYFIVAGDMNTYATGDRSPTATCTLGYLQLLDDADTTNNFIAVNETLLSSTATHQLGSVLDHIIVSPALYSKYRSGSITVKTTDPNYTMTDVSDHYPVLLELDL
ncbi:MAG TPA: endonuclease/exonuclease/phosphatase family protein [Spirochaetia bacterium]|nr:endonuclease/exonuclease/phosphatase family protein [Spirochaetia bacterium]